MIDIGDECIGRFGEWFGHKYQAVFNEEPVNPNPLADFERVSEVSVRDILAANTRRTYLGHVCRRCGKVVDVTGRMEQP